MTVAYDAMLASVTPGFIVLVEPQVLEPLHTWTKEGAFTNVYSCAFASQVATSVVKGGLYRRLDFVRQNSTGLTSRASAALVDANLGSYFFDEANSKLYVSTTTGVSPDTFALLGAWFTLPFATSTPTFTGQMLYQPRIVGELPAFTSARPDPLFGDDIANTGRVALNNTDGLFDRLSRQWVWRNKKVTFKLGGTGLAYSDFATVGSMRINAIQVDDEVAILELETIGSILNRSIPPRTWGDGSAGFFISGEDVLGQSQPWLFGVVKDCKLPLTNNGVSYGQYSTFQTAFSSPPPIPAVVIADAVYAINRTTRVRTTLIPLTDYNVSTSSITINTATYVYTDYEIWADLHILNGPQTAGAVLQSLLLNCGEDPANIDSSAFGALDLAAPFILGVYLTEPVKAKEVVRTIEQSIFGQVFVGGDGRWTARLWDPSSPAAYTLADADFTKWTPHEDLQAVLNEVRAQYDYRHATGSASEASSSDDVTLYASETSDSHRVLTYLRDGGNAADLAERLRFLHSAPAALIEFEERGLTLMGAQVGDLIAVTRARGPIARTGTLDGQIFMIERIEKSLGPDVPTVRGVLNDLQGQTDRIFRLGPAGSTAWSAATAAQRAIYGFLTDANGYIDPTDPLTYAGKVLG